MTAQDAAEKADEVKGADVVHYNGDKGPIIGARHVQIVLVSIGTGILFSTRVTFTVLLVAMTEKSSTNSDIPIYNWKNSNVIISAILWSGIIFQLISGHWGKLYGPKWFILGSLITNSIAFSLIPLAASAFASTGVIICRVFQGLAQGIYTPLCSTVFGTWAPPEERSRMSFLVSISITLNLMLSSIIAGIISKSSLGWPWFFYIYGIINIVWSILWFFIAQQDAARHPRITPEERKYIQVSLNQKSGKDIPTPWIKIFTSIHVWAIIVANIGANFIGTMLSSEKSIFLSKIMEFDIQQNGILGSIPVLCSSISGVIVAILSDFIIKNKILSIVNSRRLFHLVGTICNALCLVLLTFVPAKYSSWSIVILCFEGMFTITSAIGGSTINMFDISPMFASVISGASNTLGDSISLFAPLLAQWIITDQKNIAQWRETFTISAIIAVSAGLFFAIFASDKRENWENPDVSSRNTKRESITSIEETLKRI